MQRPYSFFLVCTVSSLWCGASIFSSCGTQASLVVVHQLNHSTACGILYPPPRMEPPCPLHWKTDSWPLDHQGNPGTLLFIPIYFPSNDSGSWSNYPSRLSNHKHILPALLSLLMFLHQWQRSSTKGDSVPQWTLGNVWSYSRLSQLEGRLLGI